MTEEPRTHDPTASPAGGAPRKGSDQLFVDGFAAGLSAKAVAAAANVSERTARRRRQEPDITAQVQARRAEIADDTSGLLVALGARAVDVLGECLEEGDLRDRLAAAKALLQIGPRYRADVEFEGRLRVLEATAIGERPVTNATDPIWGATDDEE